MVKGMGGNVRVRRSGRLVIRLASGDVWSV